jgi:outer membrane receptor protein involved in Fe transport
MAADQPQEAAADNSPPPQMQIDQSRTPASAEGGTYPQPYDKTIEVKVEERNDVPGREPEVVQLEDVVVTATKREKSSREIPASITALRGEDLERIGARDIKDYLMQAPGITMDDGEYGEAVGRRMTIRGIGPAQNGIGNQTVGQFIGDAPMGDPYTNYGLPDVDPFDLKTVEILRGPQGTTFGASALNGAVRYVPNEPVLQDWSARGFVDRTSLSHTGRLDHDGDVGMSYGAAVNAPIGDELAFRASGVLQNAPGTYDNLQRQENSADSFRKWSGRAALRWEPGDRFSANLLALKQRSHMNDVLIADNPDGRLENNNKPGPSAIDFEFSMANADLRYRLDDWGTVVLQGTWQTKVSDGNVDAGLAATGSRGIEALRAGFSTDVRGDVQEVRLVSPDGGNWDWIVGASHRNYTADVIVQILLQLPIRLPISLPSLPLLPSILPRLLLGEQISVVRTDIHPLRAKESALYGELTRRFGSHWEATVGARRYATGMDGVFDATLLGTIPEYNHRIDQKESGLSPKFSLTYKANRNLMTYATISRGFQFGGVNTPLNVIPAGSAQNPVTGTPIPLTYDSSVLWNRELGLRTDWLDRTLRLDLALYDIQWNDAQLSQTSGGVFNTPYVTNIGEVESRGVEGSFTWLTPLRGVSLNLLGSYVRAVTATDYDNAGTVIPKGTEMPAAPRVQTSATLAYNTNFGPWITAASVTHAYWSRAYSDIQHTYEIYDFMTIGMNLRVARPDLPMMPALTLGVTNLEDERGVVGRNVAGDLGGEKWTYIRPRAISLRFTAEFD